MIQYYYNVKLRTNCVQFLFLSILYVRQHLYKSFFNRKNSLIKLFVILYKKKKFKNFFFILIILFHIYKTFNI